MNTEEASAEAVHKVKNAQQAVEFARQTQIDKIVSETARQTKEALLDGLKEVFGESDSENPQHMKVLVRRIPILCVNVQKMHTDISVVKDNVATINDNIKWAVRIVLGAVLLGILKVIFLP